MTRRKLFSLALLPALAAPQIDSLSVRVVAAEKYGGPKNGLALLGHWWGHKTGRPRWGYSSISSSKDIPRALEDIRYFQSRDVI